MAGWLAGTVPFCERWPGGVRCHIQSPDKSLPIDFFHKIVLLVQVMARIGLIRLLLLGVVQVWLGLVDLFGLKTD